MFLAVEAYWDTGGTSSAHILQLKEHTQWWIATCVCMCVCMCWQWGDKKCAQWLLYVWGCIHIAIYVRPITSPPERPRLQLQPRTKPLDDTSGQRERGGGGGGGRNSSSIFWGKLNLWTLQQETGRLKNGFWGWASLPRWISVELIPRIIIGKVHLPCYSTHMLMWNS